MGKQSFTKIIRNKGTKGITQAVIYIDVALMKEHNLNIGDELEICKK